ncbi:MAG: hypothetical protein V1804_02960 [Patescibacteria group bacterium]
MKMKLIRVALIAIFIFAILPFSVKAQNLTTSETVSNSTRSGFETRGGMIISQEANKLKILFGAINNEEVIQPGVQYSIQLIHKEYGYLVDEKVFPEVISIGKKEKISKEIEYQAPEFLNGDYLIFIVFRNSKANILGTDIIGKVSLKGSEGYVNINTCLLSVKDDKIKNEFFPNGYPINAGIDLAPEEELIAKCKISNNFSEAVEFTPQFENYFRSIFGTLISTEKQSSVNINAGETREVSFTVPKISKPQAYDAVLSLFNNGEIISNKIVFHYVIQGFSGTIQNLLSDEATYQKGETAKISFYLTGSADYFPGARGQGSRLEGGVMEISISNKDGSKCSETVQKQLTSIKELTNQKQGLEVPIIADCSLPQIKAEFKDRNGNVLDRATYNIFSNDAEKKELEKEKSAEKKMNKWILISGLILIILLISVLAYLFYKKKSENKSIATLIGILAATGVFFLWGGVSYGASVNFSAPALNEDWSSIPVTGFLGTEGGIYGEDEVIFSPGQEFLIGAKEAYTLVCSNSEVVRAHVNATVLDSNNTVISEKKSFLPNIVYYSDGSPWYLYISFHWYNAPMIPGSYKVEFEAYEALSNVGVAYLNFKVMAPNPILAVNKAGTGSGTITSDPAGINCGTDCAESYVQGTSATLTATPDANSTFAGWSGDCTGTGPCNLTMNTNKSVTANFKINTPPTAEAGGPYAVPRNGTVTIDGSQSSDPDEILSNLAFNWDCNKCINGGGNNGNCPGYANMRYVGFKSFTFNPNANFNTGYNAKAGNVFTCTLTVTDNKGATSTDTATITATETAPNAPTGLTATAPSCSSVTLTWVDTSDNETGFKIERSANSNGPWTQIATTAANATSADTIAAATTQYYYRVRATNLIADSDNTNVAGAYVPACTNVNLSLYTSSCRQSVLYISSNYEFDYYTIRKWYYSSWWGWYYNGQYNLWTNRSDHLYKYYDNNVSSGSFYGYQVYGCYNSGQCPSASLFYWIYIPSCPALNLSISPSAVACGASSGGASSLTWSSTNANYCIPSGTNWPGNPAQLPTSSNLAPLVNKTIISPTSSQTYSLTCYGAGGSITKSVNLGCSCTANNCADNICGNEQCYNGCIWVWGNMPVRSLSITKAGTGSGTVTGSPAGCSSAGINCGPTCSATYKYDTAVNLTATAFTGSEFTNWSNACNGTANSCTVFMRNNYSVNANFNAKTLNVSLTASPPSGSQPLTSTLTANVSGTSVGTINYKFYCNRNDDGTNITQPVDGKFDGESATSKSFNCTYSTPGAFFPKVIVERDSGVPNATDKKTVTVAAILSIDKTGTGSGSSTVISIPPGINCGPTCSASYNYNTLIALTATAIPSTDFAFAGWSGACSGTGPCTVTMNEAKYVTANFGCEINDCPPGSVSCSGNSRVVCSEVPVGSGCYRNITIDCGIETCVDGSCLPKQPGVCGDAQDIIWDKSPNSEFCNSFGGYTEPIREGESWCWTCIGMLGGSDTECCAQRDLNWKEIAP